jgi:hypothetical protein
MNLHSIKTVVAPNVNARRGVRDVLASTAMSSNLNGAVQEHDRNCVFLLCSVRGIRFHGTPSSYRQAQNSISARAIELQEYNKKIANFLVRLSDINSSLRPQKQYDGSLYRGTEFALVVKTIERQAQRGLRLALKHGIPVRFNLSELDTDKIARNGEDGFDAGVASQLRWVRQHWERVRDSTEFYRFSTSFS